MVAILVAGFLSLGAVPSFSVGPYTDVSRISDFITAQRTPGLTGSLTRASSGGLGAAVFDLAGFFPLRSAFLLQLETCFVTVDTGEDIEEGFGDALLWLRARVWKGQRKALVLTFGGRFGVGDPAYFPYSTASTDVEAGVAFSDSLGFSDDPAAPAPSRYIAYWVAAGGNYVIRLNDRLEAQGLHENCLSCGGGVILGVSRTFDVEAGGLYLAFGSGAAREVYFSRVTAHLSPVTDLFVTVEGERGDWRERAVDASAQIGLTVRY
jgi:hypothetical protein